MTAQSAPKPLKTHARAPANALITAVEGLFAVSKGEIGLDGTMQDRAKAGAEMPIELPVRRAPTGPLAAELETLRLAAEAFLAQYALVDGNLVLPRVSGMAGKTVPVQGKLVVPAKHAADKFKALFGSDPRRVEAEFEDELGEQRVKIEGFAQAVSRSYVVKA